MEEIKHFLLPENTNSLYKNEAISSISLTKEVADKINEIVDSLNEFSNDDLTWKQGLEGKVNKAVVYMKDNLVNSLNDLMELLLKNGYIDKCINEIIGDLISRVDNLLNSVSEDGELIDIRVGYDGRVYAVAGEAVRKQIENLSNEKANESDFTSYLEYKGVYHRESVNLYDYTTALANTRLTSSNPNIGTPKEDSGFHLTDFIPVSVGDVLFGSFDGVMTNVNGYCTYDIYKNCLGYHMYFGTGVVDGVPRGTTITDEGTAYIRVEMKDTLGDYVKYQIQKDEVTALEPYKTMQFFEGGKKTVSIKADGTGDYTSIRTAFETEGENVTYKIYEGVYNVADDFTTDEIESANYNGTNPDFVGLRVPNDSELIGVGDKENIIVRLELDSNNYDYTLRSNIATLNLFGNCRIENITVLSVYGRTPIHDDFVEAKNSIHTIKNCILKNEVVERNTSHGYGLGLRSGLTVEIENCEIYPTMIAHSNTNFTDKATLIMTNTNVAGVLSIQDSESVVGTEVVLNNVSYGLLRFTGEVTEQKMSLYLNTECKNPIDLQDGFIFNGNCIRKYPAKEEISKGKLVSLNVDSKSITHAYQSTNFDASIGVALSDTSIGEMASIQQFNQYIDPTTCLISTISVGDKIGYSNGFLVVDSAGTVGEAIRYGDSIMIKLK